MGTAMAPNFADILRGAVEGKYWAAWQFQTPILWRRYLDDCLLIWKGDRETAEGLARFLSAGFKHQLPARKTGKPGTFSGLQQCTKGRGTKKQVFSTFAHLPNRQIQGFTFTSHPATPETSLANWWQES